MMTARIRQRWVIAALACILLHTILCVLYPQQGWVSFAGISTSYFLGTALSIQKATQFHGISKLKWLLVASAYIFLIAAFASIYYGQYILRFTLSIAWAGNLFFAYWGLPLLLALCGSDDEEEPATFLWIDGTQLLLVAVLLAVALFPGILVNVHVRPLPVPNVVALYYLDLEIFFLVVLAAARLYAVRTAQKRSFYSAAFGFLWTYAISNFFLNHYAIRVWNVPHGSPIFLLGDLPILVFIFLAAHPNDSIERTVTPARQWTAMLIRLGSPAFLALAVLLLSIEVAAEDHHLRLGIWTGILGLSFYALRSTFLQLRYIQSQDLLVHARNKLEELSRRDSLTGLYNRRWFDETLAAECKRALRAKHDIALLLIDIDHFKSFNDAMGHKGGDDCLVAVTEALQKQLRREGDSLARYGGEEFVAILPSTNLDGACLVAENMRLAVFNLKYTHHAPSHGQVTVSIGAASVSGSARHIAHDELLLAADEALYQAKRSGRNRVESANFRLELEPVGEAHDET
jgi:diguanylate cyclase (GGDEF)-like protein